MAQPTLTPREFAQKWGDNETKEKAASQEPFLATDYTHPSDRGNEVIAHVLIDLGFAPRAR